MNTPVLSVAEPESTAVAFGAHIRAARQARGLSLRELARRLEISPGMLSQIETDKAGVSAARLYSIASVLGISFDALLGIATTAPPATPPLAAPAPPADWRVYPPEAWDPVLAAALKAFVEVGYHGATVRDIARRCGLSVPGLYHYHRSKQDMLVAILDITMHDLFDRCAAARDSGTTPADRFMRMIESLALFHTYRREPAFIGASEIRSLEGPNRGRHTAARNAVARMFDVEVEAAVADGTFTTSRPHEASRAAITMCTAAVQWYRPQGPLTPEQVASHYVEFAAGLMLSRATAPEASPGGKVRPRPRPASRAP